MIIPVKNQQFELGYGATTSEDLGVTPRQLQADPARPGYYIDGFYQLSFSVENTFPPYPGYYTAEIYFGTQELGETSGWGVKMTTAVSVVFPGPPYIVADQALPGGGKVQGSSNLVLKFIVNDGSFNGGWPIKFSNVSMTFTPVN